jgi:molybdate transport system permease protein
LWSELTPAEATALWLSLKIGLWSVAAALPVAFGLAWLLARGRFPGKALLDAVVHLPLVLPPVVTGFVLLLAFGRNGPIGIWLDSWFGITVMFRWTGAALAAGVMALPLMVRAMRLSIEAVDTRLEVAARTLGATPWHAFQTIVLPLSLPGVVAGAVLGFARSVGEFGATITFVSNIPGETQTLPIAIYSQLQVPGGEAGALRLSVIAVLLSLAALVVSEWLARRWSRGRVSHVV